MLLRFLSFFFLFLWFHCDVLRCIYPAQDSLGFFNLYLCFILGNSHPRLFKDFLYPILSLSGTLIKSVSDPLTLISSLYTSRLSQSIAVFLLICILLCFFVSSAVYSLLPRFFIPAPLFFFLSSFIWLTPFQTFPVAVYIPGPGDILKFVIYLAEEVHLFPHFCVMLLVYMLVLTHSLLLGLFCVCRLVVSDSVPVLVRKNDLVAFQDME